MKLNTLLPTLALIAKAMSIDILSDTITRGTFNTQWDGVYVAEGANWSVINNDHTYFNGDVVVDGGLFVKAEPDFTGLTLSQGAIWFNKFNVGEQGQVVADSRGTTFTAFYSFSASHFDNKGKIWLADAGDAGIPTLAITSQDWNNEGLIHAYQDYRSAGWLNLGYDLQKINNNGAICLQNVAYRQANTINGNGCIDIGSDSTAWLAYTLYSVADTQTLVFSSTNGYIKADAWGKDQTYNVVGFGDDNVIGMSVPIKSYTYNGEGILSISDGATTFNFNIGTGYDDSKFEKLTPDFGPGIGKVINGGIKYNGSPVNTERPSTCPVCEAVPDTPTDGTSLIPSSSNILSEIPESTTLSNVPAPSSTEVLTSATSSEVSSTDDLTTASSTISSDAGSSGSASSAASTSGVSSAISTDAGSSSSVSDIASSGISSDAGSSGSPSATAPGSSSDVVSNAASATDNSSSGPSSIAAEFVSATTVSDIQTTVVTITSCSDNQCTKVPVTTGVTTITDETTSYTTYCPLTTDEQTSTIGKSTVAVQSTASAQSTVAAQSTIAAQSTVAAQSTGAKVISSKAASESHFTTVIPSTTVATITSCAETGCEEVLSTSTTEVTTFITLTSASVEPVSSVQTNGTQSQPTVAQIEFNAGVSLKPFTCLIAIVLASLI